MDTHSLPALLKSFFRKNVHRYFTVSEVSKHFPQVNKEIIRKLLKELAAKEYISKRKRDYGNLNEYAYIDPNGVLPIDEGIYDLLRRYRSNGLHLLDIAEMKSYLTFGEIYQSLERLAIDRNLRVKPIGKSGYYRYYIE